MKKLLIKLENIHKQFQTDEIITKVLHGIDLEMNKGEFVAIMGPSGSGKSTLMNIMGFLDKPTTGKYYFEGNDVSQLEDDQLAVMRSDQIGFIFQAFNLLPRTSVYDNVMMPLMYTNIPKKIAIKWSVIQLKRLICLTELEISPISCLVVKNKEWRLLVQL